MSRLRWSWEKNRWHQVPEKGCSTSGCRFQAVPGKVWCIRHRPTPELPAAPHVRAREQLSLF